MNVQERDQLLQFFSSLQRTPAQPRDPVAEELIRQALSEGLTPYALVQRAMGLSLALDAAKARLAQLEARCQAQAAQLEQARAAAPLPAHGAAVPSQSQPSPANANASVWGQGLLRQAAGTAVGVAAGVMAGGLLLEGWQRLMGEGAASPGATDGLADAGSDLWSISDDWT